MSLFFIAKLFIPEEHTVTIRTVEFETEFVILILNATCGVFAQLLITLALKVEEAGTISLARSVDILLSFIVQATLLKNEQIYWTSILGAFIIGLGVTLSALNKLREKRNRNNDKLNSTSLPNSCESEATSSRSAHSLKFERLEKTRK